MPSAVTAAPCWAATRSSVVHRRSSGVWPAARSHAWSMSARRHVARDRPRPATSLSSSRLSSARAAAAGPGGRSTEAAGSRRATKKGGRASAKGAAPPGEDAAGPASASPAPSRAAAGGWEGGREGGRRPRVARRRSARPRRRLRCASPESRTPHGAARRPATAGAGREGRPWREEAAKPPRPRSLVVAWRERRPPRRPARLGRPAAPPRAAHSSSIVAWGAAGPRPSAHAPAAARGRPTAAARPRSRAAPRPARPPALGSRARARPASCGGRGRQRQRRQRRRAARALCRRPTAGPRPGRGRGAWW